MDPTATVVPEPAVNSEAPLSSEPAQDVEQLLKGTGYHAVRCLGAGGMGEIYEALAPGGSETVVVKLLRAHLVDQADMVDRMRVEGEALGLLRHPNIVAARGHGTTSDGRPFVVMERLHGSTLQDELRRRGALPIAEAIHHTRRLLSALGAVHRAGIVHRDVKPENLMVSRRHGLPPQLKLLDFGVAKVFGGPGQLIAPLAFPTLAGACVGTPRYASPEQARGASVDPRTDIYAAGIVLYTLVAGRGPFDEIKGAGNVLMAHLSEEPPPPSRFMRWPIPPALESVILRAIAKDRNDRFVDACSFSRELLVTMGKMCLPSDLMASPSDIANALTEPRAKIRRSPMPPRSGAPSAVRAELRGDDVPTVAASAPRNTRVPGRSRDVKRSAHRVSRAEVLLSAAAFAALACGAAMWFVH